MRYNAKPYVDHNEHRGVEERELMYLLLKYVHVCMAVLSIGGFTLRGYWMMSGSSLLERRSVRVLPHIVDTLFLLSGIALIAVLGPAMLKQPWLLAKFAGLLLYIILGAIALRRGKTMRARAIAFCLALGMFAYIVGAAVNKTAASWLVLC